ncbi:MAG: hypothetical protein V5A48_03010, partial [Salinivenus sp.]
GRRLASEAQEVGEAARREVSELAKGASERFRKASDEASRQLRERGEQAAEGVQEFEEEATEAVEEYAGRLAGPGDTSSDDGRPYTRTLLSIAGTVAGGYLALKLRGWV